MTGKVLMLGLDALVAPIVERLMGEGILPNFRRLVDGGCFCRLLSSIPAQTPANWQTVATGATPGSHSVTVWGGHRPGDPIPETHREEAFSSGLCLAEYVWEAAARQGKRSVVMNYAGYPATTEKAVHIDGVFRPSRSYYDIQTPTVYHTLGGGKGEPIAFAKAKGWKNVPESKRRPLEAGIDVPPATEGTGPSYFVLLLAEGDGYDTLLLCDGKDAAKPVLKLKVGRMSDWVRAEFDSEETGKVEGAMRFKLIECSADGKRVRLYRSEVFPTDARFVSDAELGRKLIGQLGPYVHAMMTCELHMNAGLLDWETVDEALADEAVWWSEAARLSLEETGADLFYMHWHLPDMVGHRYVQWVDPTGTAYTPERAEEGWKQIRNYYRAIDRFVGEFVKRFPPDENVIAIVAEHGMPANKKAVALINAFRDKGWLKFTDDKGVDWAGSKVFFDQNHLWISLKGREPNGIVPAEEYEALRSAVQALMRDIKDPETEEHVFSFVLTREEAPMVGMWGKEIGDLVFCYAGGYRWSGDAVLKMGEERVVFPCEGGNHGPMICTYETDVGSVYGLLVVAGTGVRKGVPEAPDAKGSRKTIDIAPTLSHMLGIKPPAQSEGRVLHEFLEEFESARPKRTLRPMGRNIVARRKAKPKVQLKGDVTDEV